MDDLDKQKGISMLPQALYITSKSLLNSNLSYSPETLNSGQNWQIFVPCDLEKWRLNLKKGTSSILFEVLCIIS